MVLRGWNSSIAVAAGVAAAAGAAQLGMAYGTGVISWPQVGEAADQAWNASLAWAVWIAASSTIAGAVVAARLRGSDAEPAGDPDRVSRVLWRMVLVVAAAIGALITVLLTAVPAREVVTSTATSPPSVVAGFAVLGVLLGLLLATGALAARAVAANLIATAGWLWLLAVVAVSQAVATGRDLPHVPLGFWHLDSDEYWFRNILFPDAGITLAAALVLGALAALPAARRGDHPVGIVASGAAGPLLLVVAYLVAQPDLTGAAAADLSRHLVVPYLVLVGLAGSLLITTVRPRTPPAGEPEARTGKGKVPAARRPAEQPELVKN
jgi:hypothetical protein